MERIRRVSNFPKIFAWKRHVVFTIGSNNHETKAYALFILVMPYVDDTIMYPVAKAIKAGIIRVS